MGNNLTNEAIKDSFQYLVQISGSQITDGTGSLIPSLDITASLATNAVSSSHAVSSDTAAFATSASYATSATLALSASHAVSSDTAISASYATTASYAENAFTPNLQQVSDVGYITTNPLKVSSSLTPTIEIQSTDGTYDASLNFQRGLTYEGYVATTTESLELAGLNGRNVRVSGSGLVVDGGITGSLLGNASTATSASYALTASYAENAGNPTLQDVLTAGNTATSNINLTGSINIDASAQAYAISASLGSGESVLLTYNSDGAALYSNRGNSILWLGVNQAGQQNFITLGSNAAIGFYGNAGTATTPYKFFNSANGAVFQKPLNVSSSFTASGLIYPTTDGTAGQVIGTDGLGNLSFITAGGGGSAFPFSGSAVITGSLVMTGITQIQGNPTQNTIGTGQNDIVWGSNNDINTSAGNNVVLGGIQNAIGASGGFYNAIIGGSTNTITGGAGSNDIIAGYNSNINGTGTYWADIISSFSSGISKPNQSKALLVGGESNTISGGTNGEVNGIFGGKSNTISGTTTRGHIYGGQGNVVSAGSDNGSLLASGSLATHSNSVVIGGVGLSTTKASEVVVPKLNIQATATDVLVIGNYASLNFADDAAAAAGGVPLGGVYRNGNFLQIRIA